MLAAAQRRVRPKEPGASSWAMDAEAMDFAGASFDCVTLPYVLSVTPNPDRLVAEVRRVCRPAAISWSSTTSAASAVARYRDAVRPLAGWLGFRTEFSLEQHVLRHRGRCYPSSPSTGWLCRA